MSQNSLISPQNAVFVLISFEGPDRYSQAGGLGVRVSELSKTLAEAGFQTHLYFVGDPNENPEEQLLDGRLVLHRWSQWISKYYPKGVYQGEWEKKSDFDNSLPEDLIEGVVRPAVNDGKITVIMSEDWHTADVTIAISDLLYYLGLRDKVIILWNANNPMGFEHINWGRLDFVCQLTAVSKYMKHEMWKLGVNPIVIPNGIPGRLLDAPNEEYATRLRDAFKEWTLLFKIGRWDPDKRWNMAIEALAHLKRMGVNPLLLARGGAEPYEGEVIALAENLGLKTQALYLPDGAQPASETYLQALESVDADVDMINLKFFVEEELLRAIYRSADCVLANSGMEPFGIVGLEAMAADGIVFTGATGEDYARTFENAVVIESDDAIEIAHYVLRILADEELRKSIRRAARQTAERYTWDKIVAELLTKLEYIAMRDGVGIEPG
ncbi:TPA: glycosyltransferase [Candidatus Poribacteria bacterium]|nr:glycosyltransferase [Candidatus Poribacteria bacterium]